MAHALINDGTYLYAGERINDATPSSVARIIKYNTNLQEVGSYDVGANKDVESMCYDSVNNRIYATQRYDDGIAYRVSILVINPSTMLPVSQTDYATLITGQSFPIVTDGTYIYGATYAAPPVIFKIRISDMALVSTVTWTGRKRAHAARIDTRYGYMYLTDIPYSASTDPYFAKVRLSSLTYTEVNIGAYVRKATDDFAMIDTGSDIYCYIGGEYVYSSGGNAGYGGVQVRVSDLSLTGITMKPAYAVCEYGDEIYSATIDANMQIFSRHNLNDVLTCNLSGYYLNELNVLGNRLFGTNFYNYNEAYGRVLEFNLCYYFPTTTTTSTTLIPPTTTTTTLPPTTTTTTTIQETVLVNWSSDIEGNIEFTIFEDGVLQETITATDSGSFYISSGDTVLVVANIMNCSPSISSYTMNITQSGSGTGNGGGCPTFLSSSASLVSNGTTMTITLISVIATTTTTTTPAPTTTTTTTTTPAPTTTTTTTTIEPVFTIYQSGIVVNDPGDEFKKVTNPNYRQVSPFRDLQCYYGGSDVEFDSSGLSLFTTSVYNSIQNGCEVDFGATVWMHADADPINPRHIFFNPDIGHRMYYLISDTEYGPADISTIMSMAIQVSGYTLHEDPNALDTWKGSFTFNPNTGSNVYLYMIWDYRRRTKTAVKNSFKFESSNLFGSKVSVDISNAQLNPLYLINVEREIADYCKVEYSYLRGGYGFILWVPETKPVLELGDPVYKYLNAYDDTLFDQNVTCILALDKSPCGFRNVYGIKITNGYVTEKRLLFQT